MSRARVWFPRDAQVERGGLCFNLKDCSNFLRYNHLIDSESSDAMFCSPFYHPSLRRVDPRK